MPGSKGIRAGRAFVELFADDSRLIRGLNRAAARMKAFGSQVMGIGAGFVGLGAAIVTPLFAAAKHFAAAGDTAQKMSLRTGFSTESLSQLGFAAEQSGASIDQLDRSLAAMARFSLQAERGMSAATDVLAEMGLTIDDLANKTPEEKFKVLAEGISRIEDPTKRAGIALAVFGRSGRELLPLLVSGRAGIEALQAEAHKLGLTISEDDAQAAAELTDAFNILWRVVKAGVFHIGAGLAPTLIAFAKSAATVLVGIGAWIKDNRALVTTIFKVGLAILAAGGVLLLLGAGIVAIGAILGGFATVLSAIGSVIGFVLSPVGLLIAAVIALGAWILTSTSVGAAAIEWLRSTFGPFAEDALRAFEAIKSALAAGDFAAAAQVLWSALNLAWVKGISYLETAWLEFKGYFLNVITAMQGEAAKIFTNLWADFQQGILQGQAMLDRAIGGIANKLLEMASQDGVLGDVARAIVGQDLRGGQAADAIAENNRITERNVAERNAAAMDIESQRQGALAEIDDATRREMLDRANETQRRIAEAQKKADGARAQFEQSTADAESTEGGSSTADGFAARMQELLDQLLNGGAALQQTAAASGTFSSQAARMFGGENIQQQQLDKLSGIEGNTRRMKDAQLAFGP